MYSTSQSVTGDNRLPKWVAKPSQKPGSKLFVRLVIGLIVSSMGVHSVEVVVMGKNELSLATSFVPRVC